MKAYVSKKLPWIISFREPDFSNQAEVIVSEAKILVF